MPYRILEMENLPDALKNKPRWLSCLIFTAGFLAVTISAVGIGIFLGYTYCYFEHHTGIKPVSHNLTNLQIVRISYPDSEEPHLNRTLHGALSSTLISRMLKITNALVRIDNANSAGAHSTSDNSTK